MRRDRLYFALAGAALAAVFVPWMLFGDVVPEFLRETFSPRWLAVVLVATAALLGAGVVRWLGETRNAADPRRARVRDLRALINLTIIGLLIAGVVFGFYAYCRGRATGLCRSAEVAESLSDRKGLMKRAAPWRARVQFFNAQTMCTSVERELQVLETDGECPRLVPRDAVCSCGAQAFPTDWPNDELAKCDHDDAAGSPSPDGASKRLTYRAGHERPRPP